MRFLTGLPQHNGIYTCGIKSLPGAFAFFNIAEIVAMLRKFEEKMLSATIRNTLFIELNELHFLVYRDNAPISPLVNGLLWHCGVFYSPDKKRCGTRRAKLRHLKSSSDHRTTNTARLSQTEKVPLFVYSIRLQPGTHSSFIDLSRIMRALEYGLLFAAIITNESIANLYK